MRALAADATDTRVVLGAQIALGGFAAAPPDLGIERGAVALAHRRAALRADLAVELAPIFLAGGGAATLGRLGAGAWAGLAARGLLGRCWRASRDVRLLFGHIGGSFLLLCHSHRKEWCAPHGLGERCCRDEVGRRLPSARWARRAGQSAALVIPYAAGERNCGVIGRK